MNIKLPFPAKRIVEAAGMILKADNDEYIDLTDRERDKKAKDLEQEYNEALLLLILMLKKKRIDQAEFERRVNELATDFITRSYLVGSGLSIDEISDTAQAVIDEQIEYAMQSSNKLAMDIMNGDFSKVDGEAPKKDTKKRVSLWVSVLGAMYLYGTLFLRPNEMLRFDLGMAEHCLTCLRLNGQIHPKWKWMMTGYYPKSRKLDCGGWHCKCSFKKMPKGTSEKGNF